MSVDGDQDIWFSAIFQYVVANMRLPSGGFHPPPPSWQTLCLTIAEGPTELRAPGPRDPTIRHCLQPIPTDQGINRESPQLVEPR